MTGFPVIQVEHLVSRGGAAVKTGPFGTQLSASEYVEQGIPVINVRNVGFGDIRDEKLEYVTSVTRERLKEHVLRAGDIVFGRKGAVERHAFIQPAQEGWVQGSDCLRLRLTSPDVDSRFVSYYLLTADHQTWMKNQCSHGATMASLNQDIVGRINLPAPPLPIQRRIASILSAYDDLIENNRKRIAILEDMARRLYREWFVHFRYPGHEALPLVDSPLGRIPLGWEPGTLSALADVFRGKSYRSEELVDEGGLPFINLKCINRDGGFRRDGIKGFKGEHKPTHIVRPGDVVMAVTDMTQERRVVARAALVPDLGAEYGIISMDLVRIVPKPVVSSAYLYFYLRFSDFADNVKQHANGANVLHLHPDRISGFSLAIPEEHLMAIFSAHVGPWMQLAENLAQQVDILRRTRDLLLPRLMSGTLSVEALATAEAAVP
jgi:type I restriction enzyme, S subunit